MTLAPLLLALALPLSAQEGDVDAAPGLINPGGYVLFYDVSGPLSYATLPGKPRGAQDMGPARGTSCQRGLSVPIAASARPAGISGAYGDGSYAAALADLRLRHPGLAGVYDVKVDMSVFSVLRVYRRICTEIEARGWR